MTVRPIELCLDIRPQQRFDIIDVSGVVRREHGDLLDRYRNALYCSYHTTAGYFEQQLAARLQHSRDKLADFLRVFQHIFPPHADYEHDKLHLRSELSDAEKVVEPINADSHLTFISSGLKNCVTYDNGQAHPVFFVDLDGLSDRHQRRRRTTVLGFDHEVDVAAARLEVPTAGRRIDSINLKDAELGVLESIREMVASEGVRYGRVELSLPPEERCAGLTVNEYETLLMRCDMAEVLKDPLRFATERGRHVLRDPLSVPQKAHDYVHYDLVRVVSELLSQLRFSESLLERAVARFVAAPAARFFRLKRSVSLLVTDLAGQGAVAHGTYQSPILLQWGKAQGARRRIDVVVKRFV